MQGLYIQEFSRLKKLNTKFNEGACIGTLERKIQLYEKKIESLEKHIDQAFVERESAISPILPSSQMQLLNPSNPLSAIQRVELKETTPNIIPKPLSRTSSRRSSKGDLRAVIEQTQQSEIAQQETKETLPVLEKKPSKTNIIPVEEVNNSIITDQ